MTRGYAKKLAERVTNQELRDMFYNAQRHLIQWGGWDKASKNNKSISVACAFNILSCGVDNEDFLSKKLNDIVKFNMIREFGEHLPDYIPEQKEVKKDIKIIHHEPKFLK